MPHKELANFLEKLIETVRLNPNLPPNEVHVFNVHASFGHYQIMIGPASKIMQKKGPHLQRPLEINGLMHHLFVTKNHVTPHPTHKQIHDNLKGCILLRDLTVHLKDPTGSGRRLEKENKPHAVGAREKINLAGSEGDNILKRMEWTGNLAKQTYKIVQEDILHALINKQYTVGH